MNKELRKRKRWNKKLITSHGGRRMYKMSLVGMDRMNAISAINQGIDARLEAFTKSSFRDDGRRLSCEVHEDELQIMIRRLYEMGDETESLADNIVRTAYEEELKP